MESGSRPTEVLETFVRALEDARVPYMLTGSFASAIHGLPRATLDIDMVIAPDAAALDRLLRQFPAERYYVSRDAATQAFANAGMFNVVDLETGWKIDFIMLKGRDFSRTEFGRRRETDAYGVPLLVASPEDAVISKLEWAKIGESERQIQDAAGIIRTQGKNLDVGYIEKWVGELQLDAQWNAARSAVGGG